MILNKSGPSHQYICRSVVSDCIRLNRDVLWLFLEMVRFLNELMSVTCRYTRDHLREAFPISSALLETHLAFWRKTRQPICFLKIKDPSVPTHSSAERDSSGASASARDAEKRERSNTALSNRSGTQDIMVTIIMQSYKRVQYNNSGV